MSVTRRRSSKSIVFQFSRWADRNSIFCGGDCFRIQCSNLLYQSLAVCVQLLDFPVGIGQQNRIGPGQGVQQFFNFVLHLGKLHIQGGQLGIDGRCFGGQGLKFGELLHHLPIDELLKLRRPKRPAALTAFVVRPLGAPKILRPRRIAHAHKGIPAAPTFDFSGQPGIPGLAPSLKRDICQQLLSAPKPGIGGDNALAGGQHKDLIFQVLVFSLLHVPALVEIAAIGPGEVRRLVHHHGPLPLEKLVQLQVSLGVNRVAEHLRNEAPFQFLAVNQDIVFSKVPGNIPERCGRLGVHLEHQPGDVRRGGVRRHHFCTDTLEGGRLQFEAERGRPAHVEAPLTPGIVSVGHSLLDCLTL